MMNKSIMRATSPFPNLLNLNPNLKTSITLQVEKDPTNIKIDCEKDPMTPKGTKLPLVQPEELGECGGKATSGEVGEGVTEVDWGIATMDKCLKKMSMKELEPVSTRDCFLLGFTRFNVGWAISVVHGER